MESVSSVYKKLYHYTTWEGARGILESQSLWSTHYKFLNDFSEIILFKDKMVELLQPHILEEFRKLANNSQKINQAIISRGGLEAVAKHDTEALVDANYAAIGHEIYITSFCGEHKEDSYINLNGLLSQWRAYGKQGGLAIVFKTKDLEDLMQEEGKRYDYGFGMMADVVYSNDEKTLQKELAQSISNNVEFAKKIFLHVFANGQKPPDASDALPAFAQCIGRYKHRGFKEENEVRMFSLPVAHTPKYMRIVKKSGATISPEKERKFREKNGEMIPYIDCFNEKDLTLPIEKIIVGPHKEKEARAASLRVLLRNTNIEIAVSDIPYTG